jgi:hypothetical protein
MLYDNGYPYFNDLFRAGRRHCWIGCRQRPYGSWSWRISRNRFIAAPEGRLHPPEREANMTPGFFANAFTWLGPAGNAVPPRHPNDDDGEDEEDEDEDDDSEPAVIREPDEDE